MFGFVEEDLQIPILIVAGLVWTVILSLAAGSTSTTTTTDSEDDAFPMVEGYGVEMAMLQLDDVAPVSRTLGFNGTSSYYSFSNGTDIDVTAVVDPSSLPSTTKDVGDTSARQGEIDLAETMDTSWRSNS